MHLSVRLENSIKGIAHIGAPLGVLLCHTNPKLCLSIEIGPHGTALGSGLLGSDHVLLDLCPKLFIAKRLAQHVLDPLSVAGQCAKVRTIIQMAEQLGAGLVVHQHSLKRSVTRNNRCRNSR